MIDCKTLIEQIGRPAFNFNLWSMFI